MRINWMQLAQIKELKYYFEADFLGFKQQIEAQIQPLLHLEDDVLDNLALLRVLEVTNGCTQWGFRRQDENCLPIDQTRECMRVVIGFIKEKRIDLATGETVHFTEAIERLIDEGRELYQNAFKKNIPEAEKEYYAYSTAQFLVYGRQRLEMAMAIVKRDFETLFSPYYIQKGYSYIEPYFEAVSPSDGDG